MVCGDSSLNPMFEQVLRHFCERALTLPIMREIFLQTQRERKQKQALRLSENL